MYRYLQPLQLLGFGCNLSDSCGAKLERPILRLATIIGLHNRGYYGHSKFDLGGSNGGGLVYVVPFPHAKIKAPEH